MADLMVKKTDCSLDESLVEKTDEVMALCLAEKMADLMVKKTDYSLVESLVYKMVELMVMMMDCSLV